MERMVSNGVYRGWNFSVSNFSVLAAGRGWGRVALTRTDDGVMQRARLLDSQGNRTLQNPYVTFYSKTMHVNVLRISCGARKSKMAQAHSQHSDQLEYFNVKRMGQLDVVQNRGEYRISKQAVQATTAHFQSDGIESILPVSNMAQPEVLQGTKEWLDLRKNRITASAFGNALGFWNNRRVELWEEKIGLKEPFAGNPATIWGSSQEAAAVEKYKEITENSVEHIAFKIYKDGDEYLSWLGASPDGLITYKFGADGHSVDERSLGILEVKCPHNKGRPELGSPWDMVPYYYMPQAQGLLEIFDRKYMDFYVWTINGSAVFRIQRDPEYWGFMYRMMAELWWGHVVPAQCALRKGKTLADIQVFRPGEHHPATEKILEMSRCLAQNSGLICRERMGQVEHFL